MKKNTVYTLGSLIILLICAFCFVVLPAVEGRSSRAQGEIPAFGKYNGKEIKYEQGSEFSNFVSQYGQMYQMYGQQLDQTAYYQIFNQAFNSTVLNYAYTDAVKKSGYTVPQSAITREILPYFEDENGKYSSKVYKQTSDETKLELKKNAESSLLAERFSSDNFGSTTEKLEMTELYGLKNSQAEKDFIAGMNKEQREFRMALFPKSDYPLDEEIKFGKQNADKFKKYDMSVITVEDKAGAEKIAKRIANSEITFEDAVVEYSDKNYSSTDGKVTNSYQYQIQNILDSRDDFASISGLAAGETSPVIKTIIGYSIFRNNAAVEEPDFDTEATQKIVSAYMAAFESTLIEDYFIAKASDFVKKAKAEGFGDAADELGISSTSISQFPLNYGNANVLNSIDTSTDEMKNAEKNENFLNKAFALKLDEISDPFVLNNNIVVLQYIKEGSSDDDGVNVSLLTSYDKSSATDAVLKSDKLENNFISVYFDNFMR